MKFPLNSALNWDVVHLLGNEHTVNVTASKTSWPEKYRNSKICQKLLNNRLQLFAHFVCKWMVNCMYTILLPFNLSNTHVFKHLNVWENKTWAILFPNCFMTFLDFQYFLLKIKLGHHSHQNTHMAKINSYFSFKFWSLSIKYRNGHGYISWVHTVLLNLKIRSKT